MRQSCAETLVTEEPDELIAHVRVCGGAGWVTTGSTRKPTPYSLRFAAASRRGSPPAFGCAETNRHDGQECQSPTVQVSPTTLAPRHARASVTGAVKRGQGNVQAEDGAPQWPLWVPPRSEHAAGPSGHATLARRTRPWRGRRPLAGTDTSWAGLGRLCVWPGPSPQGPPGAPHGHDRDARTQGVGQCQRTRAATAPRAPGALQNTPAQAATAEVVAGRERAQGHAGPHTRGRTQGRAARSRARDRGRQAAQERALRLPALGPPLHAIARRREAADSLQHDAAPGVEGQTGAPDGAQRDTPLRDLAARRQRGASPAAPGERVSLPNAAGRQRPRGTPTLAAHRVQRAPVAGLHAIDEEALVGFS
jgi:hypothetical protein